MIVGSYFNVASSPSAKLYVPVQPAQVIYSQFEHVSGYAEAAAAPSTLSRLFILNSLLGKANADLQPDVPPENDISQEEFLQGMETVRANLAAKAASADGTSYFTPIYPLPGTFMNVTA